MKKPSVEERRVEILETTCQVVVERGFGNTRIADVANKLDVSTGLIHYHFDSKDHLLAEAFALAANTELVRLQAAIADETTAMARLDKVFNLYTPSDAEPGWILWIDVWGEAIRSPALRAISQDLDLRWKENLEAIIREGIANDEFECEDPSGAAWRLSALMDGFGLQVTVHHEMISREQMLAWVRHAACLELGLPLDTFKTGAKRRRSEVA